MRAFGLVGVIVAALVALAAGVIGYNIGLGANLAASGTVVAHPYWGFGFFHPFFAMSAAPCSACAWSTSQIAAISTFSRFPKLVM